MATVMSLWRSVVVWVEPESISDIIDHTDL